MGEYQPDLSSEDILTIKKPASYPKNILTNPGSRVRSFAV